ISRQTTNRSRLLASTIGIISPLACQREMSLSAGHGQVDVCQNLGIEQGAVQIAAGVIDPVALAERIQAVALTRMALAGHQQGIEHRTMIGDVGSILLAQQRELVINEADIE